MKMRQEALPILTLVDLYAGLDGYVSQIAIGIVLEAYQRPRYPTALQRTLAARDYRISIEFECLHPQRANELGTDFAMWDLESR